MLLFLHRGEIVLLMEYKCLLVAMRCCEPGIALIKHCLYFIKN